jgi:hypothetical protein
MAPNAAPMITPMARSTTLPLARTPSCFDTGGHLLAVRLIRTADPHRHAPANHEIRSGRRITQIAADCNGKSERPVAHSASRTRLATHRRSRIAQR